MDRLPKTPCAPTTRRRCPSAGTSVSGTEESRRSLFPGKAHSIPWSRNSPTYGARELSAAQEQIAARWAGARQRSDGSYEWNRRSEERFAGGFVDWMRDGFRPPDPVKSLFGKFKKWLRGTRRTVRHQASPEVAKLFEDMLLGGDQPAVVAYEANRAAMGNTAMADFRDSAGRTMRVRHLDNGQWRVMGRQGTAAVTPAGREVRRPEWVTVGDYPQRDDALREVSGVPDGNVLMPTGNPGMRHETLQVAPARQPSTVQETATLSEHEAAVREEAKKIEVGDLYQRDEDPEIAAAEDRRPAPRRQRPSPREERESAFQRGRIAERRRFLRRDAVQYLRKRIGEIHTDMMRVVDQSKTLPLAFRTPVRQLAGVLDLSRPGRTPIERSGVRRDADPLELMAKIVAAQEAALNEVVGLDPEQVSVMSQEQLAAAQGPVIDGAVEMMREVPQIPFAQLKLRDLEKLHNTIMNAVHLMRRLQQMRLQDERSIAQANRGAMVSEIGRSGQDYKPKLGNLQWLWDATVGIGVKKPEILFANLGGGRMSRVYDYWRRLKGGRVAERRTFAGVPSRAHDVARRRRDAVRQRVPDGRFSQRHGGRHPPWRVCRRTSSGPAASCSACGWRGKTPYSREKLTASAGGVVLWNPKTHSAIGDAHVLNEDDTNELLQVIAPDAQRWEEPLRRMFGRMFDDMSKVHVELHGYGARTGWPALLPGVGGPHG